MNQRKLMKNYYEFLGIIPGGLAENETEPVIKQITDFFVSQKAELTHNEYLGRKRLAYPIKHLRHGYYFLIEFYLSKDGLKEIEKKLRLNENLLRYLIIKTKPKTREEREKEKMRQQANKEKKDRRENKLTKAKISTKSKDEGKISLDDLDKKLDEILEEKL